MNSTKAIVNDLDDHFIITTVVVIVPLNELTTNLIFQACALKQIFQLLLFAYNL